MPQSADTVYGYAKHQIHPFFEKKRAWSKVKDQIVGQYIRCYLKTVQHRGAPIILVDAFAGPGSFGDQSDGSPLIICKVIDKTPNSRVPLSCIFSDSHEAHRVALAKCLREYVDRGVTGEVLADFLAAARSALEIGKHSTLFFYLDPYGIKDLDFKHLTQIFDRDHRQSTEVLINFSFPTFMRMSGNWSYADSATEIARRIKRAKLATLNAAMDGDYWIDIVTDPGIDKIERENRVVQAYVDRVRRFFPFTYSIPVKQLEDTTNAIPADEIAKYHLIFGTRSRRAVVYMNDVALNALTPYLNQFKDGLLFEVTPTRYQPKPVQEVAAAILQTLEGHPMTRPTLYEQVIPRFFLQRRKSEYRAIVDHLTFCDRRIFPDPRTLKRKTQLNDATLLSTRSWPRSDISGAPPVRGKSDTL